MTPKESSPLLVEGRHEPPVAARLYNEIGSLSLSIVAVLSLVSLALNVLVLTPSIIFLTVDFLPSLSVLPSTHLQDQVRVWTGPYTIFHTIDMLAKKRMYFLVVILVTWSIVFPFAKLLWLLSVLFRRRRPRGGRCSTATEVGWLAQLGRWSLLDVMFVLLIKFILMDEQNIYTLNLIIAKLSFGVRATVGEGMLLFPLAILCSIAAVTIVELHVDPVPAVAGSTPRSSATAGGGAVDPASKLETGAKAANEAKAADGAAAHATVASSSSSSNSGSSNSGGGDSNSGGGDGGGGSSLRPWLRNALIYGRDCRAASAGPAQMGALLAAVGIGLTVATFVAPLFTVGDLKIFTGADANASALQLRMLHEAAEPLAPHSLQPPVRLSQQLPGELAEDVSGGAFAGLVGELAGASTAGGALSPDALAKSIQVRHNRWSLATALGSLTREQGAAMGLFAAGVVLFTLVVPLCMFAALLCVLLMPLDGGVSGARAALRVARLLSTLSLLEVLFVAILIYISQAAQHLVTLSLGPGFVSLTVLVVAVMPAALVLTQRALLDASSEREQAKVT